MIDAYSLIFQHNTCNCFNKNLNNTVSENNSLYQMFWKNYFKTPIDFKRISKRLTTEPNNTFPIAVKINQVPSKNETSVQLKHSFTETQTNKITLLEHRIKVLKWDLSQSETLLCQSDDQTINTQINKENIKRRAVLFESTFSLISK